MPAVKLALFDLDGTLALTNEVDGRCYLAEAGASHLLPDYADLPAALAALEEAAPPARR